MELSLRDCDGALRASVRWCCAILLVALPPVDYQTGRRGHLLLLACFARLVASFVRAASEWRRDTLLGSFADAAAVAGACVLLAYVHDGGKTAYVIGLVAAGASGGAVVVDEARAAAAACRWRRRVAEQPGRWLSL